MVKEMEICVDGLRRTIVISDEPEALLAAKAAGRAIIGVEQKAGGASLPAARYIVPGWEFVTEEASGPSLDHRSDGAPADPGADHGG